MWQPGTSVTAETSNSHDTFSGVQSAVPCIESGQQDVVGVAGPDATGGLLEGDGLLLQRGAEEERARLKAKGPSVPDPRPQVGAWAGRRGQGRTGRRQPVPHRQAPHGAVPRWIPSRSDRSAPAERSGSAPVGGWPRDNRTRERGVRREGGPPLAWATTVPSRSGETGCRRLWPSRGSNSAHRRCGPGPYLHGPIFEPMRKDLRVFRAWRLTP
jgi:hypothetical protein